MASLQNKFDGGISAPPPVSNPGGRPASDRTPKASSPKPKRRSSSGGSSYSRPSYSAPSYSGGGGGGGGASSNAMGVVAPVAPPVPTESQFLTGDDTYQSQISALAKALANYRAQMGQNQTNYNTNYTGNVNDLNTAEGRTLTDLDNDYASRGMLVSGLYGKARSDEQGDFNTRLADLASQKQQYMQGLANDYSNFQDEQNLSKQKAQQDALARRSAQYGV